MGQGGPAFPKGAEASEAQRRPRWEDEAPHPRSRREGPSSSGPGAEKRDPGSAPVSGQGLPSACREASPGLPVGGSGTAWTPNTFGETLSEAQGGLRSRCFLHPPLREAEQHRSRCRLFPETDPPQHRRVIPKWNGHDHAGERRGCSRGRGCAGGGGPTASPALAEVRVCV